MTDYYEVLGIDRSASDADIKKAYRKMSRRYHPDIAGPEFEDKFKEVNNAYEVLSNPERRRMYDAGVDPNDPSASAGASGFGMGDMGDIFSQFFSGSGPFAGGSSGPRPRRQSGRDALAHASIDLKTAVFGGTAHVTITTYGLCGDCGGMGTTNGERPTTCPDCHGSGYRQKVVRTLLGQMMTTAPCDRCEGYGTIIEHPCPACQGHGRVRTNRDVGITIPAGISDQTRLRLAGQGEVGEGGGTAGDLYVDITIAKDRRFTRDGDDLHCWVRIPMSWAVLGHGVDIDTFDGPRTIDVPAGCQPDDTVTLKGLGVTKIRQQSDRGDLIAHVSVEIPTRLDDHERRLIEDFAASHDKDDTGTPQTPQPASPNRKGFFSKLRDALS